MPPKQGASRLAAPVYGIGGGRSTGAGAGRHSPAGRIAAASSLLEPRLPAAASIDLGERELEKLFRAEVGLGYADQARFIKDFKALVGMAPVAYRRDQ